MASAYFILRLLKNQVKSSSNIKNRKICSGQSLQKCRICLQEGYIPLNGKENFVDVIRLICDISVIEGDGFPEHLCQECNNFLQKVIMFRSTAKESDYILKNKADAELNYEDNFSDTNKPSNNIESKHVAVPLECKHCKVTFQTNKDLVLHRKIKRHKTIRVLCSVCNKLITKPMYQNHLLRHQATSHLVCEVCGKLYRKDNLLRHMQIHCSDLPFHCHICPYRGRYVQSLALHLRTHSGEKPYSCDKCHLQFLTRSNLNRHILTHNSDKPFKCIECNRGFHRKRDLDIHFRSDHAGIKDHECKSCNMKYGSKKALMQHEIRVHKRVKKMKGRTPLYLQQECRYEQNPTSENYG